MDTLSRPHRHAFLCCAALAGGAARIPAGAAAGLCHTAFGVEGALWRDALISAAAKRIYGGWIATLSVASVIRTARCRSLAFFAIAAVAGVARPRVDLRPARGAAAAGPHRDRVLSRRALRAHGEHRQVVRAWAAVPQAASSGARSWRAPAIRGGGRLAPMRASSQRRRSLPSAVEAGAPGGAWVWRRARKGLRRIAELRRASGAPAMPPALAPWPRRAQRAPGRDGLEPCARPARARRGGAAARSLRRGAGRAPQSRPGPVCLRRGLGDAGAAGTAPRQRVPVSTATIVGSLCGGFHHLALTPPTCGLRSREPSRCLRLRAARRTTHEGGVDAS